MALTEKQERFCDKYLECLNASEAYRLANPHSLKWKDSTVHKRSSEWMALGEVSGRIKEMQNELKVKSDITKERIMDELKIILDATISDYVAIETKTYIQNEGTEDEGTCTVQQVVFKDFSELTDKQLRAIESVKQGKSGIELKLHGRLWTIERICKMLGYEASSVTKIELIEQPLFGDDEN